MIQFGSDAPKCDKAGFDLFEDGKFQDKADTDCNPRYLTSFAVWFNERTDDSRTKKWIVKGMDKLLDNVNNFVMSEKSNKKCKPDGTPVTLDKTVDSLEACVELCMAESSTGFWEKDPNDENSFKDLGKT